MKRMVIGMFFVLSLGLMALMGSVPSFGADDEEAVLAQVGSYTLTLKEFEAQVQSLPPNIQMMLVQDPKLKEQFLDRWVQITLLAQEARDRKLDQNEEVKSRIETLMNSVLAQEMVKLEVEGKIEVIDDEVQAYYKAHQEDFSQPEMVKARHILLKVPADADEKTIAEAESRVKDVRKKLEEGADFASLAKEYSDDPGTKDKGGELGFFPKGRMVPEFEAAAFAQKPGEISDPVKTAFGYHIIQTEEKREGSVKALDEVQDQIRQELQRKKQQEMFEKLVEQIKAKYPVKVNKELLAKVSANPPAESAGGVHGGPPNASK